MARIEDTAVSLALDGLTAAIRKLGLNGASTNLGALEMVAMELHGIGVSIDANTEALQAIAEAIAERGK